MAREKAANVAGVEVRFSLVPLSSLKEDYSCSILVFGMPLLGQDTTFVSVIEKAPDSSGVVLSRDSGDYDILIINQQMVLIFVDERKKGIYVLSADSCIACVYRCCCCPTATTFFVAYEPVLPMHLSCCFPSQTSLVALQESSIILGSQVNVHQI